MPVIYTRVRRLRSRVRQRRHKPHSRLSRSGSVSVGDRAVPDRDTWPASVVRWPFVAGAEGYLGRPHRLLELGKLALDLVESIGKPAHQSVELGDLVVLICELDLELDDRIVSSGHGALYALSSATRSPAAPGA